MTPANVPAQGSRVYLEVAAAAADLVSAATPKKRQFAALDREVARVIGSRAPAALYSYLASAWYEFASPAWLAEARANHRPVVPGGWTRVSYRALMEFLGTRSRDSIARWIRTLESLHECPWGRCAQMHPLIVVQRDGRGLDNRYRRWTCGDDGKIERSRVSSVALAEVAAERVSRRSGNAIVPKQLSLVLSDDDESDEPLVVTDAASSDAIGLAEVRNLEFQKSDSRTSRSPVSGQLEVRQSVIQKSDSRTSLHGKTLNILKTAAKESNVDDVTVDRNNSAAAFVNADEVTDVDALVCEAVPTIVELAALTESAYPLATARHVARELATHVLAAFGCVQTARVVLLSALNDPRVRSADRPIAVLRRGVGGRKEDGADQFLLTPMRSRSRNAAGKPKSLAATTVVSVEMAASEMAASEREKRESSELDAAAQRYLDGLDCAKREAVADEVRRQFGSLGEKFRGTVFERSGVLLWAKARLRERLNAAGSPASG